MGIYCCKDKELENNDIILPSSIYKTKPPCCFDYYCPCSCHSGGKCVFINQCVHITKSVLH